MVRAAIGIGSNLGDRLYQLRQAIRAIGDRYTVLGISSLFLTEPIGGPTQEDFLNAVVLIDTEEPPAKILETLHRIESEAGRVRDEHWGPRTLDLDLLTMAGKTVETETLQLPHPRAHLRRFVVAPLAEVWPDAELQGGRAADHLLALVDQKADRVAANWQGDRVEFLDRGTSWVVAQGVLFVIFGLVVAREGTWPTNWRWSGLVLLGLALYLMLQAAASLGGALTPYPTPRESTLATRGVYRWVRHPMYLGIVLLLAGVAILVGSVWAGALALIGAVFFWLKAGYEERRLRIVYAAYDDYRRQVRGRLIPGVW